MSITRHQALTAPRPALDAFVPRSSDDSAILESAPIEPSDVLEGEPLARAGAVAELGSGLNVWLWDCTAGRFHWSFGSCDEIVHIVSGAVVVTDQEGTTFRLEAGDVAAFRAKTRAIWDVEDHVRKVAVTRDHRHGRHWRVVRKVSRMHAQRRAARA